MKIILPKKEKHSIAEISTGQTFVHDNKLYLKIDEVYDAETLNNEVDDFHDISDSSDIEATVYRAINLETGYLSSLLPSTSCELVEVECTVRYV